MPLNKIQGVAALGHMDQPPGGVERAVDEDLPGGGPVGNLQHLVGTEEAHRVGPRLGAAPEGVYADLPLVPGT